MAKVETIFGTDAGKVWKSLSGSGPLTVTMISQKSKLPPSRVYGALGWLAREGKLKLEGTKVQKFVIIGE